MSAESCEPPKRLLGVVKPVPSARRSPHVNPYTGFPSSTVHTVNPGLRKAAGFYSQQPKSTQAGLVPRSSQLTAGLRANGLATASTATARGSAVAARAQGLASAAAARESAAVARGSAAATARAQSLASAAAARDSAAVARESAAEARAQGLALAAEARGTAAVARAQSSASAAEARGSALADRAATAATTKPPNTSGVQQPLLPGQNGGPAGASEQTQNRRPPQGRVQAAQMQEARGAPAPAAQAASSRAQQLAHQLPSAASDLAQTMGEQQQGADAGTEQAAGQAQAAKPSYASKVASSGGAPAPQANPRHRQKHKHHHHRGTGLPPQADQLDAAMARQVSQLNPDARPFLAQTSAAPPVSEAGNQQAPNADEQQDPQSVTQQATGMRLDTQQQPRQVQQQRQQQHPPFRDTQSMLASPFLSAGDESSSAESSLGTENQDPALQQANGHKLEQQKLAPIRPTFMASPFTALDTLPSFTKPVSPSKALEFPSAFDSQRSPDRRASASSSSPAGSPAQVSRPAKPTAKGRLPSATPAAIAPRATAPPDTTAASTQHQHPPTVATLAALNGRFNGGFKSEPPSPTTPLALALQSTSDGIVKKASSGRAPSTCSDIGFSLLWDDDPFWQVCLLFSVVCTLYPAVRRHKLAFHGRHGKPAQHRHSPAAPQAIRAHSISGPVVFSNLGQACATQSVSPAAMSCGLIAQLYRCPVA